jgi:hypothetical protein
LTFDGQISTDKKNEEGTQLDEKIIRAFDPESPETPDNPDLQEFIHYFSKFPGFHVVGPIAVNFVNA